MNTIDIIVVAWLVFSIIRGYHIGLVRQAASFAGFIIGLLLGTVVAPYVMGFAHDTGTKLIVTLCVTLGLGIIGAAVSEVVALRLQRRIHIHIAQTINAIFGAVFSAATTLILAWLVMSAINRLPLAEFGLNISESGSYKVMERIMPPSPPILERLGQVITPYGFPQIFINGEPDSAPIVQPVTGDVEMAASRARQSVVRIEGYACGDISSGSGFVASPGFVVTNAHVVAGVDVPVVVLGGEKMRAVPVLFDDKLDFAVLRVSGISAPALPLASSAPNRGQSGAILGHPGGGPLTTVPGVMQTRYEAMGRDIYGQGVITREVYEIQAEIHPGNSGGPFVLPDGTVAGVMFGASTTQPTASYAISTTEIAAELKRAVTRNSPVSTGNCM